MRNKTERPLYVERASLEVTLPGGAVLRPVNEAESEAWINVDDEEDEFIDVVGHATPALRDACERPDLKSFVTARLGGFDPGLELHMRLRGASCHPFKGGLSPDNLPGPSMPTLSD